MAPPVVWNSSYDAIVVGAGSSGCAVAARLAQAGRRVALIEAGGADRNPWIHVPLGYGKLFENPALIWGHRIEPSPALGGRWLHQPRGRVLGGTGAINGMTYMRGSPALYDRWAAMGSPGWSYAELLPYFRKSEANARGADGHHGADGPMQVADGPRHELVDAFVAAAAENGIPPTGDFNGADAQGAGYFQFAAAAGRRSTPAAYLRPRPKTLDLRLHARVERIVIEDSRAAGIAVRERGQLRYLRARDMVVLSAGSFNTPHLLMLSGLGPAAMLAAHGISPIRDLPGIGCGYSDHFDAGIVNRCRAPVTLNDRFATWRGRMTMGLQYIIARKGPMAATGVFGGALLSRTGGPLRELQINLGLWSTQRDGSVKDAPLLDPFSAFRLTVVDLAPDARGTISLRSPDPADLPRVEIDFLSSERDCTAIVEGLKLARRISAAPALARYFAGEARPGPDFRDDAELLDYARRFGRANHHAVGSCRMGPHAADPVDARLRVKGIDGLRIADGSIMPTIPDGNTNATCVAIGEKAADMILADTR